MAYLLIIPIYVYIYLATSVLLRPPRGISNMVVAFYWVGAALVTGGYMAVGTTHNELVAKIGVVSVILLSSWTLIIFLPLALIGLYFESWFRQYLRQLIGMGLLLILVMDGYLLWSMLTSPHLVVHDKYGYAVGWSTNRMGQPWQIDAINVIVSQIPLVMVLWVCLRAKRISLWHHAVPLLLTSVFSILIPILTPLLPNHWAMAVAALGYVPPVLMMTLIVFGASRTGVMRRQLDLALRDRPEGLIVINAEQQVVWNNPQVGRWLASSSHPGSAAPTHIWELLRGSPLLNTVRALVNDDLTMDECEFEWEHEPLVIQADVQPLDYLWRGARLLTFRDVTAARMRHDLDKQRAEMLALSTISAAVFSSLELDDVLQHALEQVIKTTALDIATIYLLDEHTPTRLNLAGKLIPPHLKDDTPEFISTEDTNAGMALETRQSVITENADPQTKRGQRLIERGLRAGISVPLLAHHRVIGVLQVASEKPHTFDVFEVALLESVGRQLAIAIDNARLHAEERRQRQIAEALRAIANVISSKQLDEALKFILDQLATIMDYNRATVLLMAEPGKLGIRAQAGFEDVDSAIPLAQVRVSITDYPYMVRLFEQRTTQWIANTTQDEQWKPGIGQYGSWIGVPLIVRDQVMGCLSVNHNEPGHFTAADVQIANAFANQVAVVVENTQLFDTETRRRIQAELLQYASYDLVTSPDLDTALAAALGYLSKMIQFDRAHIGIIDSDGTTWTPRACYPPELEFEGVSVTFDAYPLVSQVLREKRALLVTDTRENTSWKRGKHQEFEVRSWMGVPLIARDRVSGLINIDNFTPFSFSVEDLQIIQVFTHQIAAAIENFRLLEEASHQNQALQAINTVLAASSEALPQENRLQVTLERVLETLKLEGGAIHQFNPERGEYRLRAVSGLSPEIEAKIQIVKGGSEMPTICLPDCDPCFFFSVPLLSHGTQLGVLSVCQAEGLVPATTHRLLGHIGQQLGVMMDNAILFENTMRREALSTDLGRLSLAISAQLDRDTVLNLICRESTAVFNAQGAYLWLIDGTDDLVGTAAYGPGASEFKKSRCNLSNPEQIPASVIHEWRPKYVNHVAYTALLPDDLLRLTHAQSVIAVPLLKADIPIGALMLVNTEEPDAFSDWLLEQIGLLGVQAALAIQNVSLFDEIRRRLDQLRLVNEVGRYATAILSLQNLIEGVAYKLSDILRYDVISLLQVENNALYVHSVFVRNRLITPQERYLPLEGQLGQAVRRAEPILQNRHAQIEHDFKDLPTEFDCCSLAVPLIIADEVIGVLRVERIGDNTITQDDLDVLEPLAAQLAVSVSNARLFEKVRQQTLELEGRVAERTAEIRQQQERTDAVLSSVADAVIVFDLSEQVIMKNPVANLLYERYDLEMNLGDRIGALIARTLDADPDAGSTTEIIELGPVTLQAKAARLLESDHVTGSVVTLRDISRLQELDRMKDKFVSNVSHELRTPLANLKLYMSLLHSGRPERRDNYMEVMSREVERLNRLIGDLLDLSRLQSEQRSSRTPIRQPINTGEIIETVVQNNMAWAESKHNELMHECDYLPLPWILGDPDQILRAITNLVANAINYTLDGGKIWVRSRVELAEHEKPEWVIIEVTDTGIGIPAAELPDIFQRFYRGSNVNPSIPGTGLGLAIIKEIVDLHGGTIDIESEEGRGSTFRLRLPVLDLNKD